MAALASAAFLLLLQAPAAVRVDTLLGEESTGDCGPEVAAPPSGEPLREYFDSARVRYGILKSADGDGDGPVDPATCTKRDVCLLMRQLDMDFYARARKGLLTDSEVDAPPTLSWHEAGRCEDMSRGYREAPVTDTDKCQEEARKQGAEDKMRVVWKQSLPSGCFVEKSAGKTTAYMNARKTNASAGTSYGEGRMPQKVVQLCAMNRSLSEGAAAYYSPYKLKPSMEGREAASTSCSFGMMAYLSQLRETMSPCAKILTYRPDPRFPSASDALEAAERLETQGEAGAAAAVRRHAETVRQKGVLVDTIANRWCPDTWTEAKATAGASCKAPRVMAWTEEGKRLAELRAEQGGGDKGGGRKGGRQPADGLGFGGPGNAELLSGLDALLAGEDALAAGLRESGGRNDGGSDSRGRPVKVALNDASCEALGDETLASRLRGGPDAPPSYFRN